MGDHNRRRSSARSRPEKINDQQRHSGRHPSHQHHDPLQPGSENYHDERRHSHHHHDHHHHHHHDERRRSSNPHESETHYQPHSREHEHRRSSNRPESDYQEPHREHERRRSSSRHESDYQEEPHSRQHGRRRSSNHPESDYQEEPHSRQHGRRRSSNHPESDYEKPHSREHERRISSVYAATEEMSEYDNRERRPSTDFDYYRRVSSRGIENEVQSPRRIYHDKAGTYRYTGERTGRPNEQIQVIIKQPPAPKVKYHPPAAPPTAETTQPYNNQPQIIQIPQLQPIYPQHEHLLKEAYSSEPDVKKRRHSRHHSLKSIDTNDEDLDFHHQRRHSRHHSLKSIDTNDGGLDFHQRRKSTNETPLLPKHEHEHELKTVRISQGTGGVSMVPITGLDWNDHKSTAETEIVEEKEPSLAVETIHLAERRKSNTSNATKPSRRESRTSLAHEKNIDSKATNDTENEEWRITQPRKREPNIYLGNVCPLCDVGELEEEFSWLGWTTVLIFFPIGVFLLYCSQRLQCSHCREIFRRYSK